VIDPAESKPKPDPEALAQGIDESTMTEESMNIQLKSQIQNKTQSQKVESPPKPV